MENRIKWYYRISLLIFILLIIYGLHITTKPNNIKTIKKSENYDFNISKLDTFNPQNLKIALVKYNIDHWDIAYKQSILETGWWRSRVFKKNNNLFGFYYKGKYLKFDNWLESVKYYKRWQRRKYKGGDYYKFLKLLPYAEDPKYITKLKQIKYE